MAPWRRAFRGVLDSPGGIAYMDEMVSEETGTIESAGTELFFRCWRPAAVPRAALLLVHGLSEHSERYRHVGEFLAGHGIYVLAYDHRGHGRSSGKTGWVERFSDFLDDLERAHRWLLERAPGLPLFLLGHSMGGLIVTAYVLDKPLAPDYLILSGPAIVPILDPGDRAIDPTRLSRDPEVWRAYMDDPLVLRERVTDELFDRLADGLACLPGRAAEIDMPWLLIHGGDDQLCSAEGARAYLSSSSSSDQTVRIYEGGRHEMLNETNREQVLADLWEWIDSRLGACEGSAREADSC